MEPNLKDLGDWVSMEEWRSAFPFLGKTNLRLVHRHLSTAALRLVLSTELEYISEELREKYFTTPSSPEEMTIMILADLVVAFLFPEKIIKDLLGNALAEVEEAYSVILQKGGGWSSSKGNPDKRKTAVLAWYQRNQPRLFYLKEEYLQDLKLYEDRGGQEKRDFRARLLTKIVEHKTKQGLTLAKVKHHLEKFKMSK